MITTAETYALLGNQSLWDTAQQCHRALKDADVPHAIVGGVAVCLYGYQRNTADVDILVHLTDAALIPNVMAEIEYTWSWREREFHSPAGVPVRFVSCGERHSYEGDVVPCLHTAWPKVVEREGLPVLSLAALIESKLASRQNDLRRIHKDHADVVELIAIQGLDRSFARRLHKSVRETFRQLLKNARRDQ